MLMYVNSQHFQQTGHQTGVGITPAFGRLKGRWILSPLTPEKLVSQLCFVSTVVLRQVTHSPQSGWGAEILMVAPLTSAAYSRNPMNQRICVPIFSRTHYLLKDAILSYIPTKQCQLKKWTFCRTLGFTIHGYSNGCNPSVVRAG